MLTQAIRTIVPSYGYSQPAREEFLAELERTKFTPDIAVLEEYEWQAIFVTDELKKKFLKHDLLGPDKDYCFPAFTQKAYHYWQSNQPWEGAIPFECSQLRNHIVGWPPIGKIKGEVYLIRPQAFLDIDAYKQNTVQYVRDRIRLVVPFRRIEWRKDIYDKAFGPLEPNGHFPVDYNGKATLTTPEHTYTVRAWFYSGKPEYWDPIITAYDYGHVETFHSNNRRWADTYYTIRRPHPDTIPPPL